MKKLLSFAVVLGLVSLFTVESYGQYCNPNTSTSWGRTTKVVTSGGSVNINKSTTNQGVNNFTSTDSVSTGLGQSFTITVTHQYSAGIWVDWNDDGDFTDAGEAIFVPTSYNGSTSINTVQTVTVPATAATGQLRLRVLSGYYWQMAPCGYSSYTSDVEDYRVYVDPPKARDAEMTDLAPRTMCSGLQDINVRLTNRGTDSIASITIAGSVGSTSFGPTTFSGLDVKNNKDTVLKMGTFTFTGGTAYNIQFYSYNVNGSTDLKTSNDTLTINGYKNALSGTYTIGGTSPDYATPALAVADLLANGVCGPVTFNVRSGTYNGQLDFSSAINGASATNTIRFRPDPANTTAATIRHNSGFTIGFSGGVEHVSFDSLSIETYGVTRVISLYGDNDSISFNGNMIKGYNTTSSSDFYATVYDADGLNTTNFEFINNEVQYGSYGIRFRGQGTSSAQNQDGFVIKNNKFTDLGYYGLYIYYCKNGIIEGNEVSSKTNLSSGYGLYGYYCNSVDVIGNHVVTYASSWARNLYWYRCYGTSTNRATIANNMFSRPNNSTSTANYDYPYYCNYTDIVYNSWYAQYNNTSTSYGVVRLYYGTALNFSNNNIHNAGTNGYCVRVYGTPTTESNNNYYNTNTARRRYPATGGTNIINVDPGYLSTTDLHSTAVAIYRKGTPITGITTDIDGDTRHATTPCIGADEFFIPGRDASPTEVVYSPSCPGTETIKVRVENKGLDTLTSFKVDWSVSTNGGTPVNKTQVSWSGSGLYPGMDTVITLGNLTLANGSKYNIQAITSSPNNSTDQKTSNDTIAREIESAMTGTYTVGGLSPDFTTPADAVQALIDRGVCGPVVFDVRPGTYQGQMKMGEIEGSSTTNTVTWRGSGVSSTTFNYNATGFPNYATIELEGTDNMIFKHIKITNGYTGSYATGIRLHSNSHNITVDSCEIDLNTTGTSYGILGSSQYYSSTGVQNNNITISNSTIGGVGEGIRLNGTSTSIRSTNIKIENNTFKDINYSGIYIYFYFDSVQVINNDLSNFGGTSYGLYCYYVKNLEVIRNVINASGSYAMYLNRINYTGATSSNICKVHNNMVSQTGSSYAGYFYYANYADIYHNSFRSKSSYAFYDRYGTGKEVKNNIFYSESNYAWYSISTSSTYITSLDNNLYFRGNSTSIAYYGGGRTLASWKSAYTSYNANSAEGDPKFAADDDLRIANGKPADSLGATGTGITMDIFDSTRSTTHPDAGAHEFDYQPIDGDLVALIRPYDTTLCLSATDTLVFAVVNRGGDTIQLGTNGINISWSITGPNNSSGTDAANTGSVAPGDTVLVKTANSTINLSSAGKYTVKAYITSAWDKYNDNDTLEVELERTATESLTAVKDTTVYYKDSLNVRADMALGSHDVVISEISQWNATTGAPSGGRPSYLLSDDYVELSSAKANDDLSGYIVELWFSNATSSYRVYTLPQGAVTNSSGTLIIGWGGGTTSTANAYYNANICGNCLSSGSVLGYILKNPAGEIIDAVMNGTGGIFNAASGVTSSDWSSNMTSSSSSTHGIRRNGPDVNSGTGWIVSSSTNRQDPNTLNNGMDLKNTAAPHFKWTYNGTQVDTLLETQAGPWTVKGTKNYIASFVSPCTGDTIKDTATIVAYATNLVLNGNMNEYYSFPLSQSSGVMFSGSVNNLGDSLGNIRVNAMFAGTAAGDTLVSSGMPRFGNSNYEIENNGLNTTVGTKTIVQYLNTTDDFPGDDTATSMVNMTDSVMAREDGNYDINVASASFGSFGHRFTVYSQDSVTGGMVHISQAFPGDKFKLVLHSLNGNSVGAQLNESVEITLQSTSDTGWKYLRLKCLSVLDTGDYLLAMTKTSSVFSSSIGGNQTNATANASFGHNGTSWSTIIWSGNPFNMGIRLVFGSYEYPTFAALAPVCESGSKLALSGGLPSGGNYFGTGVSSDSLDPTALTVGSNNVFYRVANTYGCYDTISASVEVKAEPTVSSTFTQMTSCVTNNASISVNASNGFGTFGYSITGGSTYQGTGTFNNLGSGSYTVVVKDSVCVVTDTTYVATPPGAPNKPTASGGATYCKGDTLSKLMVTTNTTGSAGTFRWYKDGSLTQSHGTGDSIAPADTTITQVYYVIEDRLGCLSAADTTTVTINALPSVSNTSLTNRCTNEDTVVLATGSPSGGTYSGNGVWNNIFYPDSAGSGSHVITYSYTDGNNCTNDDTASVTIYQAPVTALAAQDSSCTNAQSYALTGGTPTGGTYSGFGVSSGNFDPATAGIGLHTIQYKVTNTNCADSSQASIRVHQAPTATISTIADRCEDAATLTLSVGSPSGGVYIGNGVSGGVFDPSMAGPGSHTIKYVYTDNNQCMDSANTTAQVDSLPMVMFGTLNDVCANTPQFPLTQGSASPTGGTGTYFGTGVTSPDFDPASAGAGSYSLGYAYVDANGCRDTAYSTQQVDTVPVVTWTASLNDVCLNGGPKTLSGGLPSGGMYNGSGVNSGIFYPDSAGAGSHSLYYVFTDGNNCTDSAGQAQLVDPLPAVSFSLPNNWCLNDSPISLNNGTPMGGVYTINGTVDTVYQTTVSKVDTVIYAYTDTNNCTNWDTAMIKADTVPVVTFGSVPDVCINSGALNFTQGAPMGGWYTGNRVRLVATYDPLVATTDTITYHFMDANNCSDSTTSTITVNPLPVVNITAQADVCENTPTFAMSGGTPTGGTYKGAGVSSNNYTASTFGVGTDNITYVYVDGNNCTDSATTSLVVHKVDDAKFNFMFGVCDNGDLHDLTPFGLPKGGTFKGNSVSGNDFDPKAAGVGTYSLTYVYTNSNSCQDSASRDITVEASPVFNIVGVRLEACDNNPAVLTTSLSGQAQYTYHWKDGSRGDTAYVRQGGDMWVKVTDGSTDDLCANYDTISGITYDAICVGIDEQLTGTSVRYYPNPNQGHFFYELEGFEGLDVDVTIHSATGQVVYETTLRNVSNFYSGEIEVESFESGVYFINLSTERGNVMHRITLNR